VKEFLKIGQYYLVKLWLKAVTHEQLVSVAVFDARHLRPSMTVDQLEQAIVLE